VCVSAHHSADTRKEIWGVVNDAVQAQFVEERTKSSPSQLQDNISCITYAISRCHHTCSRHCDGYFTSAALTVGILTYTLLSLHCHPAAVVIFLPTSSMLKKFERVSRCNKCVLVVCGVYRSQHRQPDLGGVERRSVKEREMANTAREGDYCASGMVGGD
jgi:hypothetical protein